MKSVTFVLPDRGIKPCGGFKIVYEYANYLASHNWYVEIIHIAWLENIGFLLKMLKGIAKYFVFFLNYKPSSWFDLHTAVKTRWVFRLKQINTKKVIATAWEIAELLYRQFNNSLDMYYLVQADESKFDGVVAHNLQERVYATWKYNWKLIVINDFLFKMITKYNQNVIKIINGIDHEKYKIIKQVENREKYSICMMGHTAELKGTEIGVEALKLLKNKYPNMSATLFSVFPKMSYIPDWINYEYMPLQERIVAIYNRSTVFISCSYTEGFGLPFVEAMACGCATVVSDIPAYRDISDETMTLYFEPGNVVSLICNIEMLFNDDIKRIKYAYNGNLHTKSSFSLKKSAEAFERYISNESPSNA
jgi:glycosyltransferase involved in cell wall biosynthesis